MKSEDNYLNYLESSKSIFNNDLITQINLVLIKKIEFNNNHQDSNYLISNLTEKENENISIIKDKLECENDKNIDNFLTKDIINSINDINSEKLMKEISMKNETELNEDEDNNINDDYLKIEKEIIKGFPFDLNIDNTSGFLIKNNLSQNTNKNEQISLDNKCLNNNNNINNENEKINYWNFNTNPNKIFNNDNQENLQNNSENQKINDDNIKLKNDVNSEENNPSIKNKEMTNPNESYIKNEAFKLNSDNNKINNDGDLKKRGYFDNKNNSNIESKFINKDNKVENNFFEQKDSYNKFDNNSTNLNNELNYNDQKSILYMNNKIICYNNYINYINPIDKNKNINLDKNNSDIPPGKDINNLNQDDYLITMFGKYGWICRHCNNFNFMTRNICNRCKGLKAPKTIEEINEEKEMEKILRKKLKENKIDWLCPNCKNINYGFRRHCNRCKIEKKKEFPLIISKPIPKIKGNNNNPNLAKNIYVNKNLENHLNFNY